jgi:alpha-ketoglutarate-dependent 2,4-dichlorophenoxyacetate dioxygenase
MEVSATRISVTKLQPHFGAEITGVDITAPLDDETFAEIRAAFEEHSVLVFHDQDFTDETQTAFSRRFGPLESTIAVNAGGGGEIALISNVDENDQIIPPDDKRMIFNSGNMMWHTDSSYKEVPAMASLLSGREVPPERGETEFCSMRAAYAILPEEMKERLEGLVAEHSILYSRAKIAPDLFDEDQADEVPPVRQIMVRENPANGRKALYLGAHASHVVGWPVDKGRALIGQLMEFATRPEFRYLHRWQPKDLVIWDNRSVLHRGHAWDADIYRRVMHRTTVAGDWPTA